MRNDGDTYVCHEEIVILSGRHLKIPKLFKFSLTNFQKRKTGNRKHIVGDVSQIDKSFPFLKTSDLVSLCIDNAGAIFRQYDNGVVITS